jgi:type VI protein secretion system component VasK
MDPRKKSKLYYLLVVMALILSIITFTPLVMPYGKYTPAFLHLPYTLWTGILVALLLVFLTWLAVRNHPGKEEERS